MDLRYSPDDLAFRDATRRWFEANVPTTELKTLGERREWHRTLFDGGYVGMGWPREYGGQDARALRQAIVADEMARVNAPPTINGLGIGIVGPTIIHHGTEAQKQRYLKKILAADELWCQLYSEPNAGSDLASLRTRAEDKSDHFEVNGQKIWTSYGAISDWGLLLARTDTSVAKHRGISCFLINIHQPGVDVRPLEQGEGPGAASSITKLSYSEFEKRYFELALEILGPYGQVTAGLPEQLSTRVSASSGHGETWAYAYLWSRAGTIYSGSSEIQKNVIGERVLGLPKETRADRVK